MKTSFMNTVVDSMIRPNTCFSNISEHPKHYFKFSIIIFAISGASTLLLDAITTIPFFNIDGKNYLGLSPMSLSLYVIHSLIGTFVLIVAIFWMGKKMGGSTNFKTIFSVLSFCLIPGMIAVLVVPIALTFVSDAVSTDVEEGTIDLDSGLSPGYVSDFTSSIIISNGFVIFFGAWTLILFLKAIKTVNDFGIKKSIITVLFGVVIMFLSQVALEIPSSFLLYL